MSHIPGLGCLCHSFLTAFKAKTAGRMPAPPTAAGIVAVDAGDWTATAHLLSWFGLSQDIPASRYDCGANWWAVMDPNGATICHSWIKDAHGIERLAEPGMTAWLGSYDLDAIDGPLATPAGGGFASATPIGGLTARTLQPGCARVATLTLNVAGQPGLYHLSVRDGLYIDASPMPAQLPMIAGPAFEIRVAGE